MGVMWRHKGEAHGNLGTADRNSKSLFCAGALGSALPGALQRYPLADAGVWEDQAGGAMWGNFGVR
jgi:hypothetical protein